MGKKRKRPATDGQGGRGKQPGPVIDDTSDVFKTNGASPSGTAEHSHPVISLYYRQVVTLRQYILQRIPRSSKARRRRIVSLRPNDTVQPGSNNGSDALAQNLANFLDTTLVGVWKELPPTCSQERRQDFIKYTQSQSTSQLAGTDSGPTCPQSEIVTFVISTLFTRSGLSSERPQHLLADGFQRASGPHENHSFPCSIPGIVCKFPNRNVQMLKQTPWVEILGLLGNNGEEIMLRLLLDCGIFIAVNVKKGIYCQISGLPLSVLDPIEKLPQGDLPSGGGAAPHANSHSISAPKARTGTMVSDRHDEKKPNSIVFCRRQMFYAHPRFNANGGIELGLTNHVLNRYPSSSLSHVVHLLKYIFPKQFGLNNVFVPETNGYDGGISKDYTSREDEIARFEERRRLKFRRRGTRPYSSTKSQEQSIHIPRRLRNEAVELVRQLQNRNKRCPYRKLLGYYCTEESTVPPKMPPVEPQLSSLGVQPGSSASQLLKTQVCTSQGQAQECIQPIQDSPRTGSQKPRITATVDRPKVSLTDYATPAASVSAFCQAVIRHLIPPKFLGSGLHKTAHMQAILKHVDRFIRMRQFETLSLHEVCAGIKITCISWLEPPNLGRGKLSLSDMRKRQELLHEFMYYLFDSILIPLIRNNFYVTETQAHKKRLFYFRHDVWRRLTVQPLTSLKCSMFEELKPEVARALLSQRQLGYGSLRLLPKTTGIRPIINLRRRMPVETRCKTRQLMGSSVNSTVMPIQGMLNYERARRTDLVGSSMFCVSDIHYRLKGFKKSLQAKWGQNQLAPLYFVKLDIKSCFDSIPQQNLVRLIERIVSEEAYQFMKYVEMRPVNEFSNMWSAHGTETAKAKKKFGGRVAPKARTEHLIDAVAEGRLGRRRNTVFIDVSPQKEHSSDNLLDLLDEHVRNNVVKIGKKYFRQRNGIPQGSVLSSLLCNLFYAEMERDTLGFLKSEGTLLLRLVDDFLLITLDPDIATRFLRTMIKGQPEYGISVNPTKSLVNFAASVDGNQIPRLVDTSLFPYCGNLIDTRTLEIFKDQDRILERGDSVAAALSDSLTIESRAPGRHFHRKVLMSLKLVMHPMYLDTSHNSLAAVLSNLYANLVMSAMKMYRYARSLPGRARPAPQVVIQTIRGVIQLAIRMVRARRELAPSKGGKKDLSSPLICTVSQFQVQYLAAAAFRFVLSRKQTQYKQVLGWLDVMLQEAACLNPAGDPVLLSQVVRNGDRAYRGWRF